METGEDDDATRICNILVYDCMVDAYESLFSWLRDPTTDLKDISKAVEHVHDTLFGPIEMLLGYSKQDVRDIIEYFLQTDELPVMVNLLERDEYDIENLARDILEKRLDDFSKKDYIQKIWDESGTHWSAFFGVNNQKAFRRSVAEAIDRMLNPPEPPQRTPLTENEKSKTCPCKRYESGFQKSEKKSVRLFLKSIRMPTAIITVPVVIRRATGTEAKAVCISRLIILCQERMVGKQI
uniref:Uncharacterized protein n=1 Tax=termite gut metagenome TaxID=433724 RepID=S0DG08_9ZZZZ